MVVLAQGVEYVVVNGQVLLDHGTPTGLLPNSVLRSGRRAAARCAAQGKFVPRTLQSAGSAANRIARFGRDGFIASSWRWRDGRAAEGSGLLNRRRFVKTYRGFESLSLRHRPFDKR
jgi:hypothetical protein